MAKAVPAAESDTDDGAGRSERKHKAILDAATEIFLKSGYLGTNMDEIAARAAVSKQTVYKHFATKEALFIEIVTSMTNATGDAVHDGMPELANDAELGDYLRAYAFRQLTIVVTPRIMQLRRLVVGEVARFPELAKVLYERGPGRAIGILADLFRHLARRGLLRIDDAVLAAEHFNWLVMSQPLNLAMLLGDAAIPKPAELKRYAADGVRVFLAAYGNR